MAAKRLYEGMFLVDSAQATADWDGTMGVIENVLKRADADVVAMRKWGERKLAYDIDHKSRGTYILCYFNAEGGRVAGIEKDVRLSEQIMRVLVLKTESRPAEVIEQDMAGRPVEESREQPAGRDERRTRPEPQGAQEPPRAESPADKAEDGQGGDKGTEGPSHGAGADGDG